MRRMDPANAPPVSDPAVAHQTDPDQGTVAQESQGEVAVEQPGKLLRIAMMVREMLEEVRRAPLDENAREHLADIHARVITELKGALSGPLAEELDRITLRSEKMRSPRTRSFGSPTHSYLGGSRVCSRAYKRPSQRSKWRWPRSCRRCASGRSRQAISVPTSGRLTRIRVSTCRSSYALSAVTRDLYSRHCLTSNSARSLKVSGVGQLTTRAHAHFGCEDPAARAARLPCDRFDFS